jgi:hypothetical protein
MVTVLLPASYLHLGQLPGVEKLFSVTISLFFVKPLYRNSR